MSDYRFKDFKKIRDRSGKFMINSLKKDGEIFLI